MTWRRGQKKWCGVNNVKPLNLHALSRGSLCCPYPFLYPQDVSWAFQTHSILHFNLFYPFGKYKCKGAALIKYFYLLSLNSYTAVLARGWKQFTLTFKNCSIHPSIYLCTHTLILCNKISFGLYSPSKDY